MSITTTHTLPQGAESQWMLQLVAGIPANASLEDVMNLIIESNLIPPEEMRLYLRRRDPRSLAHFILRVLLPALKNEKNKENKAQLVQFYDALMERIPNVEDLIEKIKKILSTKKKVNNVVETFTVLNQQTTEEFESTWNSISNASHEFISEAEEASLEAEQLLEDVNVEISAAQSTFNALDSQVLSSNSRFNRGQRALGQSRDQIQSIIQGLK